MIKEVHVWHLELTKRSSAVEDKRKAPYNLVLMDQGLPEFNRMLYVAVGAPWMWYERYSWNYQQWDDFLKRDNVQTWVAYIGARPVGYFELEGQANGSAEVCYFGLLPENIGKGFGRSLLEDAIDKAWELGGSRVWLHTCTLDHPNALRNYQARGFSLFKEETIHVDLPSEPLQPWMGANKLSASIL